MMMIWTKLQHIMWCAADDDDDDDDCDGDDDDDDQNTKSSFDILFIGIYSAGIGRACYNWLSYISILNFKLFVGIVYMGLGRFEKRLMR